MENHLRMSRAITDSKWDIMQETTRHQQLMFAQGHSNYRLDSP